MKWDAWVNGHCGAQTCIKRDCGEDATHVNGEDNIGGDWLSHLGTEAKDLENENENFMISELDAAKEKSK